MSDASKSRNETGTAFKENAGLRVDESRNFTKLSEVVRHLARISAENDYNAFLISEEIGYTDGAGKGSSS